MNKAANHPTSSDQRARRLLRESGYSQDKLRGQRLLRKGRQAARGSDMKQGGQWTSTRSDAPLHEDVPQWLLSAGGWSWRLIVLVAAVAIGVFAVVQVLPVLISMFIALVMTSVLRPLTNLYNKVLPRKASVAAAMLSGVLVVGGLITYVVASVAGQWDGLADKFSEGVGQILTWLEEGPLPIHVEWSGLGDIVDTVQAWITEHAATIATRAAESVGTVASGIVVFSLAVFCTVFLLSSGSSMWHWFLRQVPGHHRGRWQAAATAGWVSFSGYARGTVIIAFIDGILAGIFLAAMRVPLSAPLAVLVFIGAFIPMVGAPTAMVIAGIVALAANGPVTALIVIIGVAGIGQLEGHIFQPLIMGKQVALHPVAIAVGVLSGTFLAGILGAILAVPVMAVTWSVYVTLRSPRDPVEMVGEVSAASGQQAGGQQASKT